MAHEAHIVKFVTSAAGDDEHVVLQSGPSTKLIRWLKDWYSFFKPLPPPLVATVEIAQSTVILEPPEKLNNSPTDPSHLQNRTPPPIPTTTNEPSPQTLRLHPIILLIRKQELGKSVLNLAAPLTTAILFSTSGKSHTLLVHYVLAGLSIGCVAIFNGIVFRETIPKTANVVEQVGIITIFISFNGLLASALPIELAWVPMLCGGFCVLPFVIAALPQDDNNNINEHG